jgi:hypothetical protein
MVVKINKIILPKKDILYIVGKILLIFRAPTSWPINVFEVFANAKLGIATNEKICFKIIETANA